MDIIVVIVAAIIFGFVGRYVAASKGRSEAEGFLFGFFLSLIGIIIVALLPTLEKKPVKEIELTDEEKETIKKKVEAKRKKNKREDRIFLIVIGILIILFFIGRLMGDV
tara:strand:- start:114 stop:440 length:327 start_codon:yes stop_codon:yes gene_type:complete